MVRDPFQGPSEEDMGIRGLDMQGNRIMFCPYCNCKAEWVANKEVYGENIGKSYMIWLCRPCDAYVGCHRNSRKPYGSLANEQTRMWRRVAHSVFDKTWRSGRLSRSEAYNLISDKLGFDAHIGNSDVETCKKIINLCNTNTILGGK